MRNAFAIAGVPILGLTAILLFPACRHEERAAAPVAANVPRRAVTLTPEQLGELAAQLSKNPDRADQLLKQQGMTRASFEKAVRDVTESAEASKRYADAYRRGRA
jgi:hypothetical protein